MTFCKTTKLTLRSRLFRGTFIALTAVSILSAATAANAACGDPAGTKSRPVPKLPFLAQGNNQSQPTGTNTSIVGLWHVSYTADGALFYEAYDLWHSDRTEMETANLSPVEGNVCMGVWKKIGSRTVQLSHVGWAFDNSGISIGSFSLAQTNTVSSDGSTYAGSFDYKAYDVDGNLVQEVTGTVAATRITAN
jgi:hypothetical protein